MVPFSDADIVARMDSPNRKADAHRLLESLSDTATWDDLMYEIYVHQAIEAGLRDSENGSVTSVEQVRQKFGLPT
jgi:hypothetical protein